MSKEYKKKVKITTNPNSDSRTAPKDVSFEDFQAANDLHIEEVKQVMYKLSKLLKTKGDIHDWTKKDKEELYYKNLISCMNKGTDFVKDKWFQYHIDKEKHHPLFNCHDDINLLDIIEMIVDSVCAGKARSDEIRELEISDDILKLAVKNTVDLINDITEVE